jgi:hypothetical protein
MAPRSVAVHHGRSARLTPAGAILGRRNFPDSDGHLPRVRSLGVKLRIIPRARPDLSLTMTLHQPSDHLRAGSQEKGLQATPMKIHQSEL